MTAIEMAARQVRRLTWQLAQVREIAAETYRVKSLILHVANWPGHLPGQHVDVRLTAEDGYQAQRSYSIASPPEDGLLALTVERVDNGEVSPYLVDDLRAGDQFELRGPIGGYFVWTVATRGLQDVIYREELDMMARADPDLRIVKVLTRKQPDKWIGHRRRIDRALLARAGFSPKQKPNIYVCGSTPFVEDVSTFLVELGRNPRTVKTERFGPSGGPVP
jgi:ferredoxin-NADP reductase